MQTLAKGLATAGPQLSAEQVAHLADDAGRTLIVAGFARIDYVAVRDATTLAPFASGTVSPLRILAAAWLGKTRLIDNIPA